MTPLSSTVKEAAEQILKQDRLGRVRVPAERRAQLLAEYERRGMNGAEFAAYVGVKYPTFAYWLGLAKGKGRGKRKGLDGEGQATPPPQALPLEAQPVQWLEASVESLAATRPKSGGSVPGLVVQLPGGARLEVGDAGQAMLAAELLRALELTSGRPGRC